MDIKYVIYPLSIVCIIANSAYSLIAPFFPVQAAKKGISPIYFGYIIRYEVSYNDIGCNSIYSIAFIIVPPIIGKSMHKLGRRNIFMCGSLFMSLAMFAFGSLKFIENKNIFLISAFVSRIFQGIGSSLIQTSAYAMAGIAYPFNVSKMIAIIQAGVGLGLMVGPMIGAIAYQFMGYIGPFVVVGSLMAVFGLVSKFFISPKLDSNIKIKSSDNSLHSPLLPPSPDQKGSIITYCELLKKRVNILKRVALGFTCIIISTLQFTFFQPVLSGRLLQFNVTQKDIGFIYSIFTGAYAVSSILVIFIPQKIDKRVILIGGNFITITGLYLLGPSSLLYLPQKLILLIIGLIFSGFASPFTWVPCLPEMLNATRNEYKKHYSLLNDRLSALFNAAMGAGLIFSPIIGTYLTKYLSFSGACDVIGCLSVLFVIFYLVFGELCKKDEAPLNESPKPRQILLEEERILPVGLMGSPHFSGRSQMSKMRIQLRNSMSYQDGQWICQLQDENSDAKKLFYQDDQDQVDAN